MTTINALSVTLTFALLVRLSYGFTSYYSTSTASSTSSESTTTAAEFPIKPVLSYSANNGGEIVAGRWIALACTSDTPVEDPPYTARNVPLYHYYKDNIEVQRGSVSRFRTAILTASDATALWTCTLTLDSMTSALSEPLTIDVVEAQIPAMDPNTCNGTNDRTDLDAWCKDNCALGNCPASHCECLNGTAAPAFASPLDGSSCVSRNVRLASDSWCVAICSHDESACDATYCKCDSEAVVVPEADPEYPNTCVSISALSSDTWCQASCAFGRGSCPYSLCVCDLSTPSTTTGSTTDPT